MHPRPQGVTPPARPAPVKRSRRRWPWVTGGTVAALFVIGVANTPSTPGAIPTLGEIATGISGVSDVAVSGCSVNSEFGTTFAHATVKINNSTDRTQSYLATISVNDASGARISEINTISNSLDTGQSVTLSGMETTGNVTGGFKPGPLTCSVAHVTRFPS